MAKKLTSLVLALVMCLALCVPAFAMDFGNVTSTNITVEGVVYTIREWYKHNEKVVCVDSNDSHTVVTLSGNDLAIVSGAETITVSLDEEQNNDAQIMPLSSESKRTLWWNYGYYHEDDQLSTYGMFFDLQSGDTSGSWSGFDNKNTAARDLAFGFCRDVRALDSKLWAASAASGVCAASIAGAIAAAGPSAGVGAVIGIVGAFISGGVGAAEWVGAYNCSLDCNDRFKQFKQAL